MNVKGERKERKKEEKSKKKREKEGTVYEIKISCHTFLLLLHM